MYTVTGISLRRNSGIALTLSQIDEWGAPIKILRKRDNDSSILGHRIKKHRISGKKEEK